MHSRWEIQSRRDSNPCKCSSASLRHDRSEMGRNMRWYRYPVKPQSRHVRGNTDNVNPTAERIARSLSANGEDFKQAIQWTVGEMSEISYESKLKTKFLFYHIWLWCRQTRPEIERLRHLGRNRKISPYHNPYKQSELSKPEEVEGHAELMLFGAGTLMRITLNGAETIQTIMGR